MNEEQLLAEMAAAQAAIEQGAPEAAVNARLKERTGFPNAFALRMHVESGQDAQAADEMTEIGENPVRNFMGAALQGATFGWADELVEKISPRTGRRMRQAQEIREEHAPGATALSEMAGGLALPLAPAAGASRAAPGAMRGAMAGAARGGLFGAMSGAATGAGMAEPGSRLEGAATGAAVGGAAGAVLGAPFGALGGAISSRGGRGARVAQGMRDLTGLSGTRKVPLGRIRDEKNWVQTELYGPLQQAHPTVQDPRVLDFMARLEKDGTFTSEVPRRLRGGQEQPSFQDLQDLRGTLRGRAKDRDGNIVDRDAHALHQNIKEIMSDVFGEPLEKADAEWARVSANQRAMEDGWDLFNKESEIITEALDRLNPEQREYFHEGQLSRVVSRIERNEKGAGAMLKKLFNAGPEVRRSIASMFGGEQTPAFIEFQSMVRREASNEAIARFVTGSLGGAVTGAATGAATVGVLSPILRRDN